ncbi:hypothetical protein Patl1_22408 [Pistacia atlantica]|uniref:Uncharacterized protein n=1 Tax=Pistacia atlantica TaxID=434234 RepID=A0ACC0ZYH1_9ROSI|nr:hypothetical protein Patl1_22408 [Pistacia atlantica]
MATSNVLVSNEVKEITANLENRGNVEQQISSEVIAEQNRLIENLRLLDGKSVSTVEHHGLFKLGFNVGTLAKHTSTKVKDKSLRVYRNLKVGPQSSKDLAVLPIAKEMAGWKTDDMAALVILN